MVINGVNDGLFAEELGLIGYGGDNAATTGLEHTLATQPRTEPGAYRPVNEVFLLIAQLFHKRIAGFKIEVTGTAGAYTPAVVVKLYIIVEGHFQQRLVWRYFAEGDGFKSFLFKLKGDRVHFSAFLVANLL